MGQPAEWGASGQRCGGRRQRRAAAAAAPAFGARWPRSGAPQHRASPSYRCLPKQEGRRGHTSKNRNAPPLAVRLVGRRVSSANATAQWRSRRPLQAPPGLQLCICCQGVARPKTLDRTGMHQSHSGLAAVQRMLRSAAAALKHQPVCSLLPRAGLAMASLAYGLGDPGALQHCHCRCQPRRQLPPPPRCRPLAGRARRGPGRSWRCRGMPGRPLCHRHAQTAARTMPGRRRWSP